MPTKEPDMTQISTFLHGCLDYATAALLISLPFLLGFSGPATWILVGLGLTTVLYSLFTQYELGAVRRISMPVHLLLDGLSGLLLIVSPFVLIPIDTWAQTALFVALGMFEIGVSMLTVRVSIPAGTRPA
jgi:hypothetical protein